jgi:multiple sugar transport system permease protein
VPRKPKEVFDTMSAPAAVLPRTSIKPRRVGRAARVGWWFVLPFLVGFVVAILAPVIYAIYLSLFVDKLVGGNQFVGLQNYGAVLTDPLFWAGMLRVVLFLFIQVPVMLIIALVAALALDSGRLRWAKGFRILLFLPYAVPGVVAALVWGFMYGPLYGLAGSINNFFGQQVITPLTSQWILAAIGNITTWEFVGYNMLILYSALRTVPAELYEAASIDGAGAFRTIISIKIPALRGALLITVIFSIIGSIQLFNEPNLLKVLAPNAISSSFTPNLYAYTQSFQGQQYNYAATIAIVMGLITAVIAYIVQLRGNRGATN